ncbi:uncharacterized protein LOC115951885 [Quercus lobata]|uniref:uncharacterized protein LOC115951885 n=1 Tax=Quercus lobata TaxID=97700 RepID=UPI001247280A|nr:uncharacterized protein LOC115951885 [Quercus lobata]
MEDGNCSICQQVPESVVHRLWECGAAQDVWARCPTQIEKCASGQDDILQLFITMLNKLSTEEFELFLVQSWLIWNQRNTVVHGGKLQDPNQLNIRARDYLEEYKEAQNHLAIPAHAKPRQSWRPPSGSVYKLNFDAAIFTPMGASGCGAVVRNETGLVMVALSAKGSPVMDSEEAEAMACRKAMEFVVEASFSKIILEGDNVNVMKAISSPSINLSWLGLI